MLEVNTHMSTIGFKSPSTLTLAELEKLSGSLRLFKELRKDNFVNHGFAPDDAVNFTYFVKAYSKCITHLLRSRSEVSQESEESRRSDKAMAAADWRKITDCEPSCPHKDTTPVTYHYLPTAQRLASLLTPDGQGSVFNTGCEALIKYAYEKPRLDVETV